MIQKEAVAVIVGSAFGAEGVAGLALQAVPVATPWGEAVLHQVAGIGREAYVLYRHGLPHQYLPHQIPYQAHAWALHAVGCQALMVTSSVGVLDPSVPLNRLLLIDDLIMLVNRLPDGSACTVFTEPTAGQGHLVLSEGLFSEALTAQVAAQQGIDAPAQRVVFAYVEGPRTKTSAENRLWGHLGAQVNSMTLAPEVVLANELEVPCVGLVVGHKYSVPGREDLVDERTVADSLVDARAAMERAVVDFLRQATPVPSGNHLYRF